MFSPAPLPRLVMQPEPSEALHRIERPQRAHHQQTPEEKRTHAEADPRAPGGALEVKAGSDNAAVAMPQKGAKRAALITKIIGVIKAKLGRDKDEDGNAKAPKQKQKRPERDPFAEKAADVVDTGDDMVEAYIKFAKSKNAADTTDRGEEGSERLAFPELRPART